MFAIDILAGLDSEGMDILGTDCEDLRQEIMICAGKGCMANGSSSSMLQASSAAHTTH